MTTVSEIDGHQYMIDKMDAMAQFHVSRRIAPMMSSVLISLAMLKRGGATTDEMLMAATPGINVLSKMSDEECEYVIAACLAVVKRKQDDKNWAPVTTPGGLRLMFDDMNMMTLLKLTSEVIKVNLWGFIQGLGAKPSTPNS